MFHLVLVPDTSQRGEVLRGKCEMTFHLLPVTPWAGDKETGDICKQNK